jgi:hypothetical protein
MRTSLLNILVVGLALAGACGDDQARCGDQVCAGPAGLPCRCGPATQTSGPSKGSGFAGSPATAASADVVLDSRALGATVEVGVNQTIELTLQTIGPGAYADPQLSSNAVVFAGLGAASLPANPAGPRQVFRFRAEAPGTVMVTIAHTDGGASFALTFHVS